jgi:glucan phosphoethanolaminetransferase (alkaline phosphatase superfamily)
MISQGRAAVFSIVFGIAYTVAFYFSWALFKYYPLVRQFHIEDQGKPAGPPISWYGWLATALVISLPIALIIPRRLSDRIPAAWVAIIPALLILIVLVYEKRWFV